MEATAGRGTEAQRKLLERWLATLTKLPAIDVIWLEGSLAADRAHPWSDIDLRLGIADEAYVQLWETDRTPLLEGLGEHIVVWDHGFARAITAEGVLAEFAARKTSELDGLELYEWQFLLHRLPGGPPAFKKLPERSLAETWPGQPVSIEDVRNHTKFLIYIMVLLQPAFYHGEACAAAGGLDLLRNRLFCILYQRLGMQISKRSRELSRVFPPEFLADFTSTYTRERESALDTAAIAAAQIRTLAALGKHLKALSDQVGGGFEPEWYERLFEKTKRDLDELVSGR